MRLATLVTPCARKVSADGTCGCGCSSILRFLRKDSSRRGEPMREKVTAAPESLLAAPDQASQAQITSEIKTLHAEYEQRIEQGEKLPRTMYDFPPYRSSLLRSPTKDRSEEHTSELQSRGHLVCRLLLEKK